MTVYTPEPDVLELVETALEKTIHIAKIGKIVEEAFDPDYSEYQAEELSKFDIFEWIASKGQQNVKSDNRAGMLLELTDLYSVPKLASIGGDGIAELQFSSPLMTLEYEEIQRRFMWLYISAPGSKRRRLTDTITILNQEDHQNIRQLNETSVFDGEKICNLLKMTNSLRAELIPSATDMQMKSFNWTVSFIDKYNLVFNFTFENPHYISMDENPDTMRITFLNTPYYLIPHNTELEAIPNGW